MTPDELEAIATEIRTMWPSSKLDLAALVILGKQAGNLTIEQIRTGIEELFNEGRAFAPTISEIVHAAQYRATQDAVRAQQDRRLVLPAKQQPARAALRRYLDRIGVATLVEAAEYENQQRKSA